MPANFPTADQNRHYACFADSPDLDQLGRYFHLAEADRRLVYERRRDHTRLGMAIQVGTVRFLGTFLTEAQWNTVPAEVIRYVAAQLDLQPGLWSEYLRHRQTVFDHQAIIRQHYGYREFNHQAERFVTLRWLYTCVWLHAESPSRLFDLLVMRLRERQVLLPGISTLERCVNRVRDQVARRIWARLDRQLTEAQRTKLQSLVASQNGEQTLLDRLRHGPVVISPMALKEALLRVKELRKAGVGDLNFSWVSPDLLKKLARHAGMSKAYTIDRLSEPRKWATLAAFAYVYESRAIDDALDLFDGLPESCVMQAPCS